MSRLIDYDAQFREYFNSWYEKNKQDYLKPEQVEERLHSLYEEWAEQERSALDAMDAAALNQLFIEYAECGEVPDLVCEAIARKGAAGERGLYDLYRAGMLSVSSVITIINLLAQMKSRLPYNDYMELLSQSQEEDEIAEAAAEALAEAPSEFFEQILSAFETAHMTDNKLMFQSLRGTNSFPQRNAEIKSFGIDTVRYHLERTVPEHEPPRPGTARKQARRRTRYHFAKTKLDRQCICTLRKRAV